MNRQPTFSPQSNRLPQWQTIYCSLMLLLVVFFVMLIAYSAIDKDRFLQMKDIAQAWCLPSLQSIAGHESGDAIPATIGVCNLDMNNDFSVVKTQDGFKAVFPNPVLFASGDASLGEERISHTRRHHKNCRTRTICRFRWRVIRTIIPIHTAKFPSNWELSTMRAVNILRYLQQKRHPCQEDWSAIGFAEYRPTADNDTPEGRQKNRRIEILFRPAR